MWTGMRTEATGIETSGPGTGTEIEATRPVTGMRLVMAGTVGLAAADAMAGSIALGATGAERCQGPPQIQGIRISYPILSFSWRTPESNKEWCPPDTKLSVPRHSTDSLILPAPAQVPQKGGPPQILSKTAQPPPFSEPLHAALSCQPPSRNTQKE